MKKHIILAALLLSSAVAIAAPGAYVGVNAGSTDQKLSAEGESGSETSTGFKVYGGYQATDAIGIEAGYAAFGKASAGDDEFYLSAKPTAFYAAVTGTMPVSPSLDLFGKLGVAKSETTITAFDGGVGGSVERKGTSALFGIGAQYKFSDTMSLVAEYENYGKVAKFDEGDLSLKITQVSIGLRVAF
jgi:OOP family OmpA-OmpF porin